MSDNLVNKLFGRFFAKESMDGSTRRGPLFMPDLPGMSWMKTRTLSAGLRWKSFNLNQLAIQLAKLPEEIKQSITRQLQRTQNLFNKYPAAQHEDFRNLVRIAYCEDTNYTDDLFNNLANDPALLKTAKFAKENGLQLSPAAMGMSKGVEVEKGIDSNFWFSKFGYAFQSLYPNAIEEKQTSVFRKITAKVTATAPDLNRNDAAVDGTFQVVPKGNGFTFAIVCNEGTTYIFESTVDAEQTDDMIIDGKLKYNPRTKTKFFREEKILISMTAVVVPNLASSELYFIPADLANSYVLSKQQIKESARRKSTKLTDEELQAYKQKFDAVDNISDRIYKLSTDEDGAFFIQKQTRYARFGRPQIDKETGLKIERNTAVGEKIYLNKAQVEYLANPYSLGKVYTVQPETKFADATNAEIASGTKYYYDIASEEVKRKIYAPDRNNIEEYSKSIPALIELKQRIDELAKERSGGEVDSAHTALEGFKIYMVAPDFSSSTDVGRGKGTATLRGTEFEDVEGLQQTPGSSTTLVHKKTFVIVSQQIPVQRMIAARRTTSAGRLVVPQWRQVASGIITFKEAIEKMNELIRGEGGTVQDFGGVVLENKDPSPISEKARSVQRGERVMDQFRDRPELDKGGQPLATQQSQAPDANNPIDAAPIDDDSNEQTDTRRVNAFIDKIFRRQG